MEDGRNGSRTASLSYFGLVLNLELTLFESCVFIHSAASCGQKTAQALFWFSSPHPHKYCLPAVETESVTTWCAMKKNLARRKIEILFLLIMNTHPQNACLLAKDVDRFDCRQRCNHTQLYAGPWRCQHVTQFLVQSPLIMRFVICTFRHILSRL
jgi:hypothetical protein